MTKALVKFNKENQYRDILAERLRRQQTFVPDNERLSLSNSMVIKTLKKCASLLVAGLLN